jgi:hypothetical protein
MNFRIAVSFSGYRDPKAKPVQIQVGPTSLHGVGEADAETFGAERRTTEQTWCDEADGRRQYDRPALHVSLLLLCPMCVRRSHPPAGVYQTGEV